jgi:hypothetical protein
MIECRCIINDVQGSEEGEKNKLTKSADGDVEARADGVIPGRSH